jgi:ATP-binding cassette subfamily C protein LapB
LKALAEKDLTILISTHRLSLLSFVERILLFEQGKLVADGPRDKIISMLRGGSANKSGGPAVVQPAAEIKTRASV